MSLSRSISPDAASAAEACSRHITALLAKTVAAHGRATLVLSGGRTPKLLFDILARSGFDWDAIHFFWADERCVPPTDPQSNFRLAQECLFLPARVPDGNVHRIECELNTDHAVERYVDEIRHFFGIAAGELPRFDVVQLGMGADGHTASLFPGSPVLEDRTSIAAAVYPEHLKQWRVTLTPGVLMAARHTAFLVEGEEKAETVREVLNGPYDPHRYPAQIASRQDQDVTWFLDQAAASRLG